MISPQHNYYTGQITSIVIPNCLQTWKLLRQQLCFKKIKLLWKKMEIRPTGRYAYFDSFYWHLKGLVSETNSFWCISACIFQTHILFINVHNLEHLIPSLRQMHICHLQSSFWVFSSLIVMIISVCTKTFCIKSHLLHVSYVQSLVFWGRSRSMKLLDIKSLKLVMGLEDRQNLFNGLLMPRSYWLEFM